MRKILIAAIFAAFIVGCAAPFPAAVTPREAFIKYPGGGAPREVHIKFGFPLGVPVTIVEDAR